MLFHCHCIDCRKRSPSAFRTSARFLYFSVANVQSVSSFIRTCDSGREQKCYFGTKDGSRIIHAYFTDDGDPKNVAVKGGLLEGPDWSDAMHTFCRSAVVPIPDGVKRREAEPYFGDKE
jgi:hypothetical protein